MIDRKKLVEGLEYCIEAKDKNCPMACPFFKECFSVFKSTEPFYPIMRATLDLLKEEPDIVRCKDCIYHHYENNRIPYCELIDYGYGWHDDDFCSRGKKR